MRCSYVLEEDDDRFCFVFVPEVFDGHPPVRRVFFDGLNQTPDADASTLAAWLLAAPFLSQDFSCEHPAQRTLANELGRQWPSRLHISPISDEPRRFPERQGVLIVDAGQGEAVPPDGLGLRPWYRLALLPLSASNTLYADECVLVRSNAALLHRQVEPTGRLATLAIAVLYADFLGVSTLALPAEFEFDVDEAGTWPWRPPFSDISELLKAAGFDFVVASVGGG